MLQDCGHNEFELVAQVNVTLPAEDYQEVTLMLPVESTFGGKRLRTAGSGKADSEEIAPGNILNQFDEFRLKLVTTDGDGHREARPDGDWERGLLVGKVCGPLVVSDLARSRLPRPSTRGSPRPSPE